MRFCLLDCSGERSDDGHSTGGLSPASQRQRKSVSTSRSDHGRIFGGQNTRTGLSRLSPSVHPCQYLSAAVPCSLTHRLGDGQRTRELQQFHRDIASPCRNSNQDNSKCTRLDSFLNSDLCCNFVCRRRNSVCLSSDFFLTDACSLNCSHYRILRNIIKQVRKVSEACFGS